MKKRKHGVGSNNDIRNHGVGPNRDIRNHGVGSNNDIRNHGVGTNRDMIKIRISIIPYSVKEIPFITLTILFI